MKKREVFLLMIIAIVAMFLIGCSQPGVQSNTIEAKYFADENISKVTTNLELSGIYCGGVSGINSLAYPENSDQFRAGGGNIYLHHSGWASTRITESERITIINTVWNDRAFGIELGYHSDNLTAWPDAYVSYYHNKGIRPSFITLNAFSSDRIPDVSFFKNTIQAYRDKGVTGKIFATFEYQNFPSRIPTLANNKVSQRSDFQEIIRASGGLTIDTPSVVFFRREQNYRDWVIDAILWAKNNGYIVGIIVSPNSSATNYDEDTEKYMNYLKEKSAIPSFFIVENYSTEDPSEYANPVGNEDTPHHQLGVALLMQTKWVPEISTPAIVNIPGTIETEDYNNFYDTTAGNSGGEYRSDDVDIQACDEGGYNVGWIAENEWLDYNVDVASAGTYKVECRVASLSNNIKFQLIQDGNVLTSFDSPSTGAWQNFKTIQSEITLAAGKSTIRLAMTGGGWNLNWVKFTKYIDTPVGPVGYTYCCAENVSYTFNDVVDVAYGANGQFNYKYGVTGTIIFDNDYFGDPIYGVIKAGFYKAAASSSSSSSSSSSTDNITVLTAGDKDKIYTVNGVREFQIPTENGAVIQVKKPWQQDVQFSINGGVYQSTPEDWGGEFAVPANSNVNVKVKTPSAMNIQFNWW